MNKLKKLNQVEKIKRGAVAVSLLVVVSACGGGAGDGADTEQSLLNTMVQEGNNSSVESMPDDPGTPEFTPTVGNGLDIAYADDTASEVSNDEFIEAQWLYMQNCMQVSAMEPVVTVVEGKITPLSTSDDVVRHIDGRIQASANVTDVGASIQIRSADFDGSIGTPGSYLRSIFGRYLWFSNGYSERDYPYECAQRT